MAHVREEVMVSVVIPTYNRAEYIVEAINSVLTQTFQDFEIIVVDDGSTDGTKSILEQLSDPRIKVKRTINQGPAKARNYGIKSAQGKYVAFLDSDDYWAPEKLEKQVGLFTSKVGLVYSSVLIVGHHNKSITLSRAQHRGCVFPFYIAQPGVSIIIYGCSTVLVRRDILLEECFDENIPSPAEDYDLFLRLSKRTNVDFVEEPLVYYRIHESNISGAPDTYINANLCVLKKVVANQDLGIKDALVYIFRYHYALLKSAIKNVKFEIAKVVFRSLALEAFNLLTRKPKQP